MARSKYIGVQAQFTNYSLRIENGDVINEDWGDENSGEFKRCICTICGEYLTEHQYKNGKLVEYNGERNIDFTYSLAHKICIEKSEKES